MPHREVARKPRTIDMKWGGLLLSLGLVLIANVGAFWFGRSFKLSFAILVVSAFVVMALMVRRREKDLVRDLLRADKETQDAVLAPLDADHRREILRKLGRQDF